MTLMRFRPDGRRTLDDVAGLGVELGTVARTGDDLGRRLVGHRASGVGADGVEGHELVGHLLDDHATGRPLDGSVKAADPPTGTWLDGPIDVPFG